MADRADTTPASGRLVVRSAGYCVVCDRIVERTAEGACPAGHPAAAVSGHVVLDDGEPVPQLPRFNVAAFLIPPLWGPAHGQWVAAIFLPLWLFTDSIIASASAGGAAAVGALVVGIATLGAQAFFAKRANGLAWRRVSARMTVEEFVRRQRVWAIAALPVAAALVSWGTYYRLVLAR